MTPSNNAYQPPGLFESNPPTMSSREIAELTGKEHRNVMADIRQMLAELHGEGGVLSFQHTYSNPQNGQVYPIFHLPKRETMVLVSGYSVVVRAGIIDRWQTLEDAHPKFDPAALSRMQILQLAMESEAGRLKAESERDQAIATKALIGSKREATAMGTASAAKRKVARLQDQLGVNTRHATFKAVEKATGKKYHWLPLRKWCEANGEVALDVPDPLYGHVKSWPAGAWGECYAVDLTELFGQKEIA